MPVYIDQHDLDVTASCDRSLRELERFGDALLGFSQDAECIVALADTDPDCPVAQAYAAQFFASADTRAGMRDAQKYLDRARTLAPTALPRERGIISAAEYWCASQRRSAAAVLEQVLDDHPTDIISAKWAQSLHFDTGNPAGILRAPLKVADACDANAYLHGMLAFGYEECHLLNEAERAVHRALGIRRSEPWAHHAMAHINEARNTMDDGIRFMMDVSDTWTGLTSFMTTHNWWHVCLFLIDLDRAGEALELYDRSVWGMNRGCVQDQINAISLLCRLERIGIDIGARWEDVAAHVERNSHDQVSVFLDLQFLYALARARPDEARKMQARMEDRAATIAGEERAPWQDVALPAAMGVIALADGDFAAAAHHLGLARPFLQSIGGSHAQRELLTLFYIDALRGAGQWERVQQILSQRHRARPRTSWIRNQLHDAYANLGLAEAIELR